MGSYQQTFEVVTSSTCRRRSYSCTKPPRGCCFSLEIKTSSDLSKQVQICRNKFRFVETSSDLSLKQVQICGEIASLSNLNELNTRNLLPCLPRLVIRHILEKNYRFKLYIVDQKLLSIR